MGYFVLYRLLDELVVERFEDERKAREEYKKHEKGVEKNNKYYLGVALVKGEVLEEHDFDW